MNGYSLPVPLPSVKKNCFHEKIAPPRRFGNVIEKDAEQYKGCQLYQASEHLKLWQKRRFPHRNP
jgi:hypothetical protein